jgi:flagellar basal-body rod protein FlgC
MPLEAIFEIAASALAAQSQRLNVVASNLANAEAVAGPGAEPYRARQVVFASWPLAHGTGVRVAAVVADPAPLREVYDPKHPLASRDGYVRLPNVNIVEEMVNMISAARAYQNNVEVLNTARSLMLKTLTLGQ